MTKIRSNGVFVIGRYVSNGEDRGFINQDFSNGFIINTLDGVWKLGLCPELQHGE